MPNPKKKKPETKKDLNLPTNGVTKKLIKKKSLNSSMRGVIKKTPSSKPSKNSNEKYVSIFDRLDPEVLREAISW